jgi:hypothetical protein
MVKSKIVVLTRIDKSDVTDANVDVDQILSYDKREREN